MWIRIITTRPKMFSKHQYWMAKQICGVCWQTCENRPRAWANRMCFKLRIRARDPFLWLCVLFAFSSLPTVNSKCNFKQVLVIVLWPSKESQRNQTGKTKNHSDFRRKIYENAFTEEGWHYEVVKKDAHLAIWLIKKPINNKPKSSLRGTWKVDQDYGRENLFLFYM